MYVFDCVSQFHFHLFCCYFIISEALFAKDRLIERHYKITYGFLRQPGRRRQNLNQRGPDAQSIVCHAEKGIQLPCQPHSYSSLTDVNAYIKIPTEQPDNAEIFSSRLAKIW